MGTDHLSRVLLSAVYGIRAFPILIFTHCVRSTFVPVQKSIWYDVMRTETAQIVPRMAKYTKLHHGWNGTKTNPVQSPSTPKSCPCQRFVRNKGSGEGFFAL